MNTVEMLAPSGVTQVAGADGNLYRAAPGSQIIEVPVSMVQSLVDEGFVRTDQATLVVELTGAQLAKIHTSPIEIVPACPGKVILLRRVEALYASNGGIAPQNQADLYLLYDGDIIGPALITSYPSNDFSLGVWVASANADAANPVGVPILLSTDLAASLDIPGTAVTVVLNSGGTGYAEDDTFTLTSAFEDGGAQGVVDAVDENGAITDFHMTVLAGFHYIVGNGIATSTPGSGVGASFDVTEVDASASPARMKLFVEYALRGL